MIANSKQCLSPFSSLSSELIWISYSISKWRFSRSLTGHIGPLNYADWNANKFWACSPISFKHMMPFFMSILRTPLNHTPLKYSCLIKKHDNGRPTDIRWWMWTLDKLNLLLLFISRIWKQNSRTSHAKSVRKRSGTNFLILKWMTWALQGGAQWSFVAQKLQFGAPQLVDYCIFPAIFLTSVLYSVNWAQQKFYLGLVPATLVLKPNPRPVLYIKLKNIIQHNEGHH